jgi:hypothetical protein
MITHEKDSTSNPDFGISLSVDKVSAFALFA